MSHPLGPAACLSENFFLNLFHSAISEPAVFVARGHTFHFGYQDNCVLTQRGCKLLTSAKLSGRVCAVILPALCAS